MAAAAVERRLRELPALGGAMREGRLSHEKARLVAGVAGEATVDGWIARAEGMTCVALRQEIDALEEAQMCARGELALRVPGRVARLVDAAFRAAREEAGRWLSPGECPTARSSCATAASARRRGAAGPRSTRTTSSTARRPEPLGDAAPPHAKSPGPTRARREALATGRKLRQDACSRGANMTGQGVARSRSARRVAVVRLAAAAAPLALAASLLLAGCGAKKCPAGQTSCGGYCVDLQTDVQDCGACLHVCPQSATCTGGQCQCTTPGDVICGNACVDVQTDADNCGACGHQCGLGTCSAGACQCNTTPASVKDCTGESPECVDTATDPSNCGSCGLSCAATGWVNGICSASVCACAAGDTHCPLPPAVQTYCADLQNDASNCGLCGYVCANNGYVNGICSAGKCTCSTSYTYCNNAYCANLATDPDNCGSCGFVCPTGASCVSYSCACPAGEVVCTNVCVNTATDPNNCGSCGKVCPAGASCTGGSCVCSAGPSGGCGTTGAVACCQGGSTCCGSSCPYTHNNGVGQQFFDCYPPGNVGGYTLLLATDAANAWSPANAGDNNAFFCSGLTTGSTCFVRSSSTQTAMWCYSGELAGRGALDAQGLAQICPLQGAVDFVWF